ncbi:MAG: hypothetical protein HKM98_11090 [Gammaproteobacteria bacterium]|nr:hypothetical protein [Gammaproteobacteria bacterium]
MTVRRPQIFALVFWLIVFATLLLEDIFRFAWTGSGAYEIAVVLVLTSSIFLWFLTDARERGINPSGGLKLAVVAFAAIAVPYYKFRYFGAKRGLLFVAIVLASFACVIIALMAVNFVTNNVLVF